MEELVHALSSCASKGHSWKFSLSMISSLLTGLFLGFFKFFFKNMNHF